jgi:hypothetical protein
VGKSFRDFAKMSVKFFVFLHENDLILKIKLKYRLRLPADATTRNLTQLFVKNEERLKREKSY